MLEIKDLDAGYGELEVLRKVNIKVKPGEIVALIGPNGAGKSTVIKAIFSLADVTKGKIIFQERDINHLKTHELIKLGISYVNQGRIIFGSLSVKENLEMGALMIKDKEVVKRNMQAVFHEFPILKERLNVPAYTLSGGQQQMLAIGRGLMSNPSLILLDEPSLGLSPKLQKDMFKIIKHLRDKRGIAVLVVEQNAKKAIEIADRTYLLEDGQVALTGGKDIIKHKKIKSIYLGGR